ncbi:MAG: hypothetical protein PVH74_02630, partial [Desulfobacterales bacterium]
GVRSQPVRISIGKIFKDLKVKTEFSTHQKDFSATDTIWRSSLANGFKIACIADSQMSKP